MLTLALAGMATYLLLPVAARMSTRAVLIHLRVV